MHQFVRLQPKIHPAPVAGHDFNAQQMEWGQTLEGSARELKRLKRSPRSWPSLAKGDAAGSLDHRRCGCSSIIKSLGSSPRANLVSMPKSKLMVPK
jgi:hypothetical protein